MNKDDIRKVLVKRVKFQCQGIAVTQIGKRIDPQCQHWASVGSLFCKVHGGGEVERYIAPKDLPNLIDELSQALGIEENEIEVEG